SADDPNADAPVELVEAADELPEATYAMASAVTTAEVNIVGISWDNPGIEQDAAVYLRTSNPSGWDAWEQYETEQNPDASDRIGSDPIVIMGAGLEVQVAVSYGDHSPENTTMVVVDPQQVPADELATEDANGDEVVRASANQGTSANSDGIVRANARIAGPVTDEATTAGITRTNAPAGSVNPVIYSRADWGADERYMTWTPTRGTVGGV
ncbi:MAG: hypothetical protein Q4G46_16230, partial [Propionibacteriaceae bacterium]|nr:hypothetical protein [Propionibacteriaceae bacterium]